MIAKKIEAPKGGGRASGLIRYVVNAQGNVDPRSWTATAGYILDMEVGANNEGEKVSAVRITNCHSDDASSAAIEIEAAQSRYKGRSKASKTYHLVFSFPHGENPTLDVLHDIEDELVKSLGMEDHQRISAVHVDRDHYHVHVAINSVSPDSKRLIASPSNEKRKLMKACDLMEAKHGLQKTNHGTIRNYEYGREKEAGQRNDNQSRQRNGDTDRPIQRDDTAFRKYLRQSYNTEFAGEYGKTADAMHAMSGSSLVFNPSRSSVLLQVDALTNVDDGAAQDHPALRRSDTGYRSNADPNGVGAATLERKSGVETLAGYVARDVAPAIRDAVTWQEIHDALSDHGLVIKKRGAGLVFGDADLGIWCKASSADRDFSLRGLEQALGEFEAPSRAGSARVDGGDARHKVGGRYMPKPMATGKGSAVLYERYKQERHAMQTKRTAGLEAIRKGYAHARTNIKTWASVQRMGRRVAMKGPAKRIAGIYTRSQTSAAYKNAQEQASRQRADLLAATKMPSWNDWLIGKAQVGDTEALALLQRRDSTNRAATNITDQHGPKATRLLISHNHSVRPNGTVEYRASDGGLVLDRAGAITIPKNTPGACLLAVRVMETKFSGHALKLSGQSDIAQALAVIAGREGSAITFADPKLEAMRQTAARSEAAAQQPAGVADWIAERNKARHKISSILEHRPLKSDDVGAAIYAGRRTMKDRESVLLFEKGNQLLVKRASTSEVAEAASWRVGQPVILAGLERVQAAAKGRGR